MKNIIYLLIGISFLFSCNKENKNKENKVTITGTIVTDCAGTPFANQDFVLYDHGNVSLKYGQEVIPFTTDNKGSFSAQCSPTGLSEVVEIRIGDNGGRPILQFNTKTDLNIGNLNTTPTANYQIKIKVNNAYNAGDTLTILSHNGGGALHTLIAPFIDTTFSVYNNYQNSLEIPNLSNKNQVYIVPDYTIYRYNGTNYIEHVSKKSGTYLEGCQTGVQEVTVTID